MVDLNFSDANSCGNNHRDHDDKKTGGGGNLDQETGNSVKPVAEKNAIQDGLQKLTEHVVPPSEGEGIDTKRTMSDSKQHRTKDGRQTTETNAINITKTPDSAAEDANADTKCKGNVYADGNNGAKRTFSQKEEFQRDLIMCKMKKEDIETGGEKTAEPFPVKGKETESCFGQLFLQECQPNNGTAVIKVTDNSEGGGEGLSGATESDGNADAEENMNAKGIMKGSEEVKSDFAVSVMGDEYMKNSGRILTEQDAAKVKITYRSSGQLRSREGQPITQSVDTKVKADDVDVEDVPPATMCGGNGGCNGNDMPIRNSKENEQVGEEDFRTVNRNKQVEKEGIMSETKKENLRSDVENPAKQNPVKAEVMDPASYLLHSREDQPVIKSNSTKVTDNVQNRSEEVSPAIKCEENADCENNIAKGKAKGNEHVEGEVVQAVKQQRGIHTVEGHPAANEAARGKGSSCPKTKSDCKEGQPTPRTPTIIATKNLLCNSKDLHADTKCGRNVGAEGNMNAKGMINRNENVDRDVFMCVRGEEQRQHRGRNPAKQDTVEVETIHPASGQLHLKEGLPITQYVHTRIMDNVQNEAEDAPGAIMCDGNRGCGGENIAKGNPEGSEEVKGDVGRQENVEKDVGKPANNNSVIAKKADGASELLHSKKDQPVSQSADTEVPENVQNDIRRVSPAKKCGANEHCSRNNISKGNGKGNEEVNGESFPTDQQKNGVAQVEKNPPDHDAIKTKGNRGPSTKHHQKECQSTTGEKRSGNAAEHDDVEGKLKERSSIGHILKEGHPKTEKCGIEVTANMRNSAGDVISAAKSDRNADVKNNVEKNCDEVFDGGSYLETHGDSEYRLGHGHKEENFQTEEIAEVRPVDNTHPFEVENGPNTSAAPDTRNCDKSRQRTGGGPDGAPNENPSGERFVKLYVGNLVRNCSEDQLITLFSKYGKVVSAVVMRDKHRGESRRYGFVEMSKEEEAMQAIEVLRDYVFEGRRISVEKARYQTHHMTRGVRTGMDRPFRNRYAGSKRSRDYDSGGYVHGSLNPDGIQRRGAYWESHGSLRTEGYGMFSAQYPTNWGVHSPVGNGFLARARRRYNNNGHLPFHNNPRMPLGAPSDAGNRIRFRNQGDEHRRFSNWQSRSLYGEEGELNQRERTGN